jgi:hypothetical protein
MIKNNFVKSLFVTASLLIFSFSALAQEENTIDTSRFYGIAVIQALNKTTAKSVVLEVPVNQRISFGTLKVIAHKCWQAPLDQRPESKVLLEVFETKSEKDENKEERIFYGWMFASTPSISGLENPIYDLTILKCKNR